jgi:hypothetical protein
VHGPAHYAQHARYARERSVSLLCLSNPERNVSTKIRVNNLSRSLSIAALRELFATHGAVENVKLVSRDEARPCIGYVTMPDAPAAAAAVAALHGSVNDGLVMTLQDVQRPLMRRQRDRLGNGNGRSNGGTQQRVRRSSSAHDDGDGDATQV